MRHRKKRARYCQEDFWASTIVMMLNKLFLLTRRISLWRLCAAVEMMLFTETQRGKFPLLDFFISQSIYTQARGICRRESVLGTSFTYMYILITSSKTVNSANDIKLLEENPIPDLNFLDPDHYIFQQHGATSHTSKATQNFIQSQRHYFYL